MRSCITVLLLTALRVAQRAPDSTVWSSELRATTAVNKKTSKQTSGKWSHWLRPPGLPQRRTGSERSASYLEDPLQYTWERACVCLPACSCGAVFVLSQTGVHRCVRLCACTCTCTDLCESFCASLVSPVDLSRLNISVQATQCVCVCVYAQAGTVG